VQDQAVIYWPATKRFLEHLRLAWRYSPATVEAYRHDLGSFGRSLAVSGASLRVPDITPADVYRWVDEMALLARSTVRGCLSALSAFFRTGIILGYGSTNPVDSVERPSPHRRVMPCPSAQEVRQLLAGAREGTERLVLLTFCTTGLRRGELLALCPGDLDLARRRFRIKGKCGKEREVIISSELAVALIEYSRGQPSDSAAPLFRGAHGGPLSKTTLQRWFQRWLSKAGLASKDYTLHSLRRFAATRWRAHGLNLRQIQLLLGHENPETTAAYLSCDLDEIAKDIDNNVPPVCEALDQRNGNAPDTRTGPHDTSPAMLGIPKRGPAAEFMDENALHALVSLATALSQHLATQEATTKSQEQPDRLQSL